MSGCPRPNPPLPPAPIRPDDPFDDPFGDLADPEVAEDAAKLAGIFEWLADNEFPGYSPLYEHLARRIAAERWIPAFVSRHNRSPFAAVLFLDCVRELTLVEPDLPLSRHYEAVVGGRRSARSPDPWPLFRDTVRHHRDFLADQLERRAIQTNEVGRSAALVPGLRRRGRTLRPAPGRDRGRVQRRAEPPLRPLPHRPTTTGARPGPPDATVRLACEVRGPLRPPLPRHPLAVTSRLGIDVNPVDITDPDSARWLESCLWPDVPHRVERFRAAAALARSEPPELWRGNAVDLVARAVDAVPADAVACLDATWVLAYFSDEERRQLHATLDRLGAERTIAFVTAEYDGNAPWVASPGRPPSSTDHGSPTLLGLGLWDHGRTDHGALALGPAPPAVGRMDRSGHRRLTNRVQSAGVRARCIKGT